MDVSGAGLVFPFSSGETGQTPSSLHPSTTELPSFPAILPPLVPHPTAATLSAAIEGADLTGEKLYIIIIIFELVQRYVRPSSVVTKSWMDMQYIM